MKAQEVYKNFLRRCDEHAAYGRECARVKRDPGTGKYLRKARALLSRRRVAHSSTISSVKEQASAYKIPGSLKLKS